MTSDLVKRFLAGTALSGFLFASAAQAADAPAASGGPTSWWDSFKLSGAVEVGITGNPDDPSTGVNFGHLFTDRSNYPVMNQALLTAERPLDPKATGIDFGFKFQGMYGTDARYTRLVGLLDHYTSAQYALDIVEANGQMHLPYLTEGGIDLKAGIFVTLEGAEVIPAAGNIFYSHSYIFNFGIPLKHTGLMTVTHVIPELDIYAGVTSGVNTWLGRGGDNNGDPAFHGGIGLNLLEGNLTVLATTHIGPEQPRSLSPAIDISKKRYLSDITTTWKITDKLTSITDLNYIYDDAAPSPKTGTGVSAFGIAQYLSYAINDQFTVAARAEIFRDISGFFVAAFPGNRDFSRVQKGDFGGPGNFVTAFGTPVAPKGTTYGELTLGVNYKPEVPKLVEGLVIRPELRIDNALNNTKPFNRGPFDPAGSGDNTQFTLAIDVVVPFSF